MDLAALPRVGAVPVSLLGNPVAIPAAAVGSCIPDKRDWQQLVGSLPLPFM
jgi:hypothetical protein